MLPVIGDFEAPGNGVPAHCHAEIRLLHCILSPQGLQSCENIRALSTSNSAAHAMRSVFPINVRIGTKEFVEVDSARDAVSNRSGDKL